MIYVVKLCAKDIQVTASNEADAYARAKEDAREFAGSFNYDVLGAALDPEADPDADLLEFDMQCTTPGDGEDAIWTFDGYLNVVVVADTEALALDHAPYVPMTCESYAPSATSYIDARGVAMEKMDFAEAIEIVLEMAKGNQIDDHDAAGDGNLVAQRAWQQTAIDTLTDFGTNHCDALEELATPAAHQNWDDAIWQVDRGMAPDNVPNAIRICLEIAESGQIDPKDVEGPEMADMIDRQNQAFALTRSLLGMHGSKLDEVVSVDTSPLFGAPK